MTDTPGALADLSASALSAHLSAGDVSAVEAAQAALDRIEERDGAVNAFILVDPEATLAMAAESDARRRAGQARGPLDGVPTSVKDLTPVAGWPNRRGSPALSATDPAPADAPCIARLREAGAIFIGKTATPESGHRIVTRSAIHGVTRNPYALDRTPGGSSGGASAALALGMGQLATGTDGAGSIRIPAAYCNLVGLKPGFGRVPSAPPSFFMPHSVTGPMARTAEDLVLMTEAMTRPEPRDPFAWPVAFDAAAAQAERVAGLRVAVSLDMGMGRAPAPDVAAKVGQAAQMLAAAGAQVEQADPVWPIDPYIPFMVFWDATYAGFLDTYPNEVAAQMAPLLHDIAARGRDVDILTYHKALADRLAITAAAHAFLTDYDVLLTPVTPTTAFDVDAEAPPGETPDDWRWCPYTYVFNMTGQPAAAAPVGFDDDGLPIGVQLAGRMGTEETLLACVAAIDAAQPGRRVMAD